MNTFVTAFRWDVVLQARNGFYWATGALVLVVGGLLVAVPETVRAAADVWVPAVVAVNLQVTTVFFVAGLMLLDRDEGTLTALAVSPLSPGVYVAARITSLTALAAVEVLVIVWLAFHVGRAPLWLVSGTVALGIVYTGVGTVVASRYASVNGMLLPASAVVALLLLPLLPHFGFGPRMLLYWHPVEPALTLLRAAYVEASFGDLAFGIAGSVLWSAAAFLAGRKAVGQLMRDTRAWGGR